MKERQSVVQDKHEGSPRRDYSSLYIIAESRWLAAVHFYLTIASVIVLYRFPTSGLLPLALSAMPLLFRMTGRKVLIGMYAYNFFVLIFLATAMVGYWAAYDPVLAWMKFRLILAGILLFYALITQPKENVNLLAGFWFIFGVGVAVYFLLTVDFGSSAAKFAILNQTGLSWMTIRPKIGWASIQPADTAAGISLITSIFGLHLLQRTGRGDKKRFVRQLIMLGFGVVLAAFLLATSRGAMVALLATMGIWLVRFGLKRSTVPRRELLLGGFPVLVISFIVLIAVFLIFGFPFVPAGSLLHGRMELIQNGVSLVKDYPFIGGGLGALPGLLSQYILVIPFFYILNSHNLFIDVMIEQGVIGGISLLIIFGVGLWKISSTLKNGRSPRMQILSWSAFACIFIAAVHGMVDDYLYSDWGSVLVLFPAGMSILISGVASEDTSVSSEQHSIHDQQETRNSKGTRWIIRLILLLSVLSLIFQSRRISGLWFANLGSVKMAKVELNGFPSGHWSEGEELGELLPVKIWFEHSLQYDPENRLANHHLGLIQMLERDYGNACQSLEKAHDQDPGHRGITKNLGYCYAWLGEMEKSKTLLKGIPEARYEMKVYIWWWDEQGRDDLSRRASDVAASLEYQP